MQENLNFLYEHFSFQTELMISIPHLWHQIQKKFKKLKKKNSHTCVLLILDQMCQI